jgi:hypothetical protein
MVSWTVVFSLGTVIPGPIVTLAGLGVFVGSGIPPVYHDDKIRGNSGMITQASFANVYPASMVTVQTANFIRSLYQMWFTIPLMCYTTNNLGTYQCNRNREH